MNTPRIYHSEHWHQRAEELRTMATQRQRSPDACGLLRQLADEYDLLARRADERLRDRSGS
jgi:hypothetical protein